ncbi:MAG: hypothetical protein GY694_07710 [Gammaproteobacteria bacterium]|nr:hypothetical protein [Gammaproteobacteria bacterium]
MDRDKIIKKIEVIMKICYEENPIEVESEIDDLIKAALEIKEAISNANNQLISDLNGHLQHYINETGLYIPTHSKETKIEIVACLDDVKVKYIDFESMFCELLDSDHPDNEYQDIWDARKAWADKLLEVSEKLKKINK